MQSQILMRVVLMAVIVFFSACTAGVRYLKLTPPEQVSLKVQATYDGLPYQVIYSGVIDIDGMRAPVRLLAAFDGALSRIELVPSSGAISLFSMASRSNEAELLLPSVARGERISDLDQFLVRKIRTANFVTYLSAIFARQLPSACAVCSEALSCSEKRCRLGANAVAGFEIDRNNARLVKAVFRDRFQLNDRLIFEFNREHLRISIPEIRTELRLEENSRAPLTNTSKRRFYLKIPENFELIE